MKVNLHAKLVLESGFVGDGSDRFAVCLDCKDEPGYLWGNHDQPCPRCKGTGFVGPHALAFGEKRAR
jgi:DnaJ-class molecular chaperone